MVIIAKNIWSDWLESSGVSKKEIERLNKLSRDNKSNFLEVLYKENTLTEEKVIEFLSDHLDVPPLNIKALQIDSDAIERVPKKLVERYQIMPVAVIGEIITVATSNPLSWRPYDDIKMLTGCDVNLVFSMPSQIREAIDTYYAESRQMDKFLEGMDDESLEIVREIGTSDDDLTALGAEDAPVIKMVNYLLEQGIKQRASDIHFEPYEKEFRIRYRIDGTLKTTFNHSLDFYPAIVARLKIMSTLNITEKRLPQDGRFKLILKDSQIDFRVSILPTYFGEKMVLRILDRSSIRSALTDLGFTEKPTKIFEKSVKNPYGMILVTGPTGSGKSTTLYSILNSLNSGDRNLMTVEDPVEYQVEGITQTQVHPEVGLTFASGLRSLLRQSPDIILVGEIRDAETADIAVKAALTGHLVFSTLHTNSAAGAMTRLMDMGVEPFLIASSVICVAAQRLVRRICPYCKKETTVSDDLLRRCNLKSSDLKDVIPYKGTGCAKCNNTGYRGRVGAIEVLEVNPEIRNLVIQKKSSDVVHQLAVKQGMETLFENAVGLFKSGVTALDEVVRLTSQD